MSLEILHANQPYIYRISESNPLIIERRQNRHRARWQMWRLCKSVEEAKAALYRASESGGTK